MSINTLVDELYNERSVYDAEMCDSAAQTIEKLHGALEKIANYQPVDDSAYFDVRDIALNALQE